MRHFYFFLLMVLMASCAENAVRIKTTESDSLIKDAHIRTTAVEIAEEPEENPRPIIEITSPENYEVINSSRLIIRLNISNFKLVTPDKYPRKGQGHVQLWVDDMEFRGSKTEFIFENESNGTHTIKAELMMSNNTVLPYSDAIKVIINK
ncbi:hypothetical protein HYY71_05980 [Candidatus Woesearchaeota archaeon]|nr:hypothetical protein [Candidatus Woesearchaeota archaeon]